MVLLKYAIEGINADNSGGPNTVTGKDIVKFTGQYVIVIACMAGGVPPLITTSTPMPCKIRQLPAVVDPIMAMQVIIVYNEAFNIFDPVTVMVLLT
jgi:hypothetical protein